MITGAKFSDCGKYRYALWRIWDENLPAAMCVGLNPSKAGDEKDDPTIRRLIGLLTGKGYGGLYMTNLFGLISSNPEDLRMHGDPVGEQDNWLDLISQQADDVIFCWGTFKMAEYRAKKIIPLFKNALCFGKTKSGAPKHPAGFIHAGIMNADIKLEKF